jgi:hypothetical protein
VALHSPPISRGEPIRGHAREGRPGTRPSPDVCVGHAESRRRLPPSLSLRSHNQSPPLSRRLTTRFRTDRTRLFMCSCISASGTVNQRQKHPRARPMLGESIRRSRGDGGPAHRRHLSAGPPRETSAHATRCRKTPYERRKTRTPRPGGQGVHSEPFGATVSRAPLEVVRAEQVSNRVGWGSALIESETPLWRAQNGVPARLERAKHPHGPVARPPAAPKSPTGSIRHRSCPVRGGTATADAGRGASGRALPQRQRWLPNRWPSRAEPLLEAWKRGFSHAFQEVAQSRKHREGWGGDFSLLLVESRPVGQWELPRPAHQRIAA